MAGDGVDLLDLARIDDVADVYFLEVDPISAGEGGSHEEVARQEDHQRNEQPLKAHEYDGEDLEPPLIAYLIQHLLRLHIYISLVQV